MRLTSKFVLWSLLNVALLAVVALLAGGWLLLGSGGLFSHALFQGGVNSAMHVAAACLQYKPVESWSGILAECSKAYNLDFSVNSLDAGDCLPGDDGRLPEALLEAAQQFPRPQVSVYPTARQNDPMPVLTSAPDPGFLPSQTALYMHAGDPREYWYARPLFLADQYNHLHYVLLAVASPSFSGNGLYFNVTPILATILAVLLLTFLWWWPFVLHVTKPITAITRTAERIAAGDYAFFDGASPRCYLAPRRQDEIKRLADAVDTMSNQLMRQMFGQRRFIRHIAHELGSPIARVKFGLAVLEAQLDGEHLKRIRMLSKDVGSIATLVEDVLTYLRSEGLPRQPCLSTLRIGGQLEELVAVEGQNAHVELVLPDKELFVLANPDCVQRAVNNVLRNAVLYAGDAGPVTVSLREEGPEAVVRVVDEGPGVAPQELEHLTEPFFRGAGAQGHPGGSGLGLSIVRYCMELCGGRLHFANRHPRGLCVSLRFPLDRKAAPPGA